MRFVIQNILFVLAISGTAIASKNSILDLYEQPPVRDLYASFMQKINCSKELNRIVEAKIKDKSWSPIMVAKPAQRLKSGIIFRNSKTSVSYAIWGNKKSVTYEISDKNKGEKTTTTFKAGQCASQIETSKVDSIIPVQSPLNEKVGTYSDEDLFAEMKKKSWGVIYVWSPYMPLSVMGISEIKKAAGENVTILLDPRANLAEAEKWVEKGLVQKSELKRASSPEISDRGLGVHYPAAYIFKDGFLANSDYVGFKKANIYTKWIKYEKDIIEKDLK